MATTSAYPTPSLKTGSALRRSIRLTGRGFARSPRRAKARPPETASFFGGPANGKTACAARRALYRSDLLNGADFGQEMVEQVLNAVLERRGGGGAAGAGALHVQIDHAVAIALEGDVAAVAGDRRADPGLDQFLDRLDRVGVFLVEEFAGRVDRFGRAFEDRLAGEIEFRHHAENGRPQMLPFAVALGDRDEIRREIDAADAGHLHQGARERRALRLGRVARLERALRHDRPAGKELQGRRIRRGFGLDEQGAGSAEKIKLWSENRNRAPGMQASLPFSPLRGEKVAAKR